MFITPYTGQQPVTDYSLRFPGLKYSATLAINTDTTLTIPGDAPRYKMIVKTVDNGGTKDGEVWVALNGTAAVPAGATFAATTSELVTKHNILCREVNKADVIHFIATAANADVSVVLYGVDQNC